MKRLYVAVQNELTREWIPVAELREVSTGYELRYTNGVQRLPGFSGFGRMVQLEHVYHSPTLFPFFANRVLSKSRPEYKSYLRWLGLGELGNDPMDILSVTGGVRATDSFEIVAAPNMAGNVLKLSFFPRGLRHLPLEMLQLLAAHEEGERILLMRDIQNNKDFNAIALRTEKPLAFAGYVPRYYCPGICKLLSNPDSVIQASLKRVNLDAPTDMRILVEMEAAVPENFELLGGVIDFEPLTSGEAGRRSEEALRKTDLNL